MEEEIKKNVEATDYSCPNCGAPLNYNPADSTLLCSYCDFKKKIVGKISSEEYDFLNYQEDEGIWKKEVKVVKCDNCSALNVISNNEMCSTCPFCGSNQVVETNELPGVRPQRVIAFKFSKEVANQAYLQKIKRNIFVPKKVKKQKIEVLINGVYIPSWTFDTNTFSTYEGRLGKHYTQTIKVGKTTTTVIKTRWFSVKGSEEVIFDDVLVNAGLRITANELKSIEPFDTNNSFIFDQQFLAGFSAEHYTVKLHSAWSSAKLYINPTIKRKILSKYSYDVVDHLNVNTIYDHITYKYVLLPVWIGLFVYNNKKYRFLVNGTNAKRIKADVPISALRVTMFVLGILGAIALIILIFIILGFVSELN